jgi:hypothetical protein
VVARLGADGSLTFFVGSPTVAATTLRMSTAATNIAQLPQWSANSGQVAWRTNANQLMVANVTVADSGANAAGPLAGGLLDLGWADTTP